MCDADEFCLSSGQDIDYSKIDDSHCVAGLVKSWFRMLPESVFPLPALAPFIALGKPETVPEEEQIKALKPALDSLPENNKIVLQALIYLCSEIVLRQDVRCTNIKFDYAPVNFAPVSGEPHECLKPLNSRWPESLFQRNL